MKILFLDIDGVLNCASTTERIDRGIFAGMIGLDAGLVKTFLDWLARHPDVKIVISSTWREDERLLDIIREANIPYIGVTRNMKNRTTEIADWLAAHPQVTAYAILDDIPQFNERQSLRFVRTNYSTGVREEDLQSVTSLLYTAKPIL